MCQPHVHPQTAPTDRQLSPIHPAAKTSDPPPEQWTPSSAATQDARNDQEAGSAAVPAPRTTTRSAGVRSRRSLSQLTWPADMRLAAELRHVFAKRFHPANEWSGRLQGRGRPSPGRPHRRAVANGAPRRVQVARTGRPRTGPPNSNGAWQGRITGGRDGYIARHLPRVSGVLVHGRLTTPFQRLDARLRRPATDLVRRRFCRVCCHPPRRARPVRLEHLSELGKLTKGDVPL